MSELDRLVTVDDFREAARARDDQAMTRSFGQLTETCVSCHVAFRGKSAR